jgi:acyl transferase domain-containing protein
MDSRALYALARARGAAMADAGSGQNDRGAMLAVAASAEVMRGLMQAEGLELVIANKNAPEQVVLSGPTPEVERAAKVFAARGLRCNQRQRGQLLATVRSGSDL